MQVTIVGRHGDVSQHVKDYMTSKLDKLPRFYDRVMYIEVIVDGQPPRNTVELVVSVAKHREFVAKETGKDVFPCFDLCLDKIERQLNRHKERTRSHKHPPPPPETQ